MFKAIGKVFVDFYVMVCDFLIECYHVYFDFITDLVGKDFAKGFTIVIACTLATLIILSIIRSAGQSNK